MQTVCTNSPLIVFLATFGTVFAVLMVLLRIFRGRW